MPAVFNGRPGDTGSGLGPWLFDPPDELLQDYGSSRATHGVLVPAPPSFTVLPISASSIGFGLETYDPSALSGATFTAPIPTTITPPPRTTPFKWANPGCCCSPPCLYFAFVDITTCAGPALPTGTTIGADVGNITSVTISDGAGYSAVMTFSGLSPLPFHGGAWQTSCIPHAGTYTITAVSSVYGTATITVTIGGSMDFFHIECMGAPCPITVNYTVQNCAGSSAGPCAGETLAALGLPGIVVTQTTGGADKTCTTNTNGQCSITFTPPGTDPDGTKYYYTTAANVPSCAQAWPPGGVTSNYVTKQCANQVVAVTINPDLDSSCCCKCCGRGYPKTLTLTDALYGACTLTCTAPGTWTGSIAGAFVGTPCLGCDQGAHCTCTIACPNSAVTITYTLTCGCSPAVDRLTVTFTMYLYAFTFKSPDCTTGPFTVPGYVCCPGPASPCNIACTGSSSIGTAAVYNSSPSLNCVHPLDLTFEGIGSAGSIVTGAGGAMWFVCGYSTTDNPALGCAEQSIYPPYPFGHPPVPTPITITE